MALKLDDNLLVELGLGALPPEEKKAFLAHIYETLEMRVGVRLAEQMSEQQLSEFEALINAGDDAGAFRWLETTFPGYKEVVADEFEKLKLEIKQVAPQILASSQQQAVASAPAGPAVQPPVPPASNSVQPSEYGGQQQSYAAPQQQQPQPSGGQLPPQQPYAPAPPAYSPGDEIVPPQPPDNQQPPAAA